MGVDTKLFLNPSVRLSEIIKVIESRYDTKVAVSQTPTPEFQTWSFEAGKEQRTMSVFTNFESYGGFHGTILSLAFNTQAVQVMQVIGGVFGGFFQVQDSSGTWEDMSGKVEPKDGLSFFMRYAIVEKGVDERDLDALKAVINDWNKNIRYPSSIKGL